MIEDEDKALKAGHHFQWWQKKISSCSIMTIKYQYYWIF